jgi:hypothetical protein
VNLDLPFDDIRTADLDEYVREIDQALDAGFMADLESAFTAAADAREPQPALAV